MQLAKNQANDSEVWKKRVTRNLKMFFNLHFILQSLQLRSRQGFCVVPCMDSGSQHLLMESCPASVLKRLELYTEPYKGNTAKHGQRRRVILDHLKMLACTITSCSLD